MREIKTEEFSREEIENIFPVGSKRKGRGSSRIINDFLDSGKYAVEITEHDYCNAQSCASSLKASINRMRVEDKVRIRMKGDRVFLVREETC